MKLGKVKRAYRLSSLYACVVIIAESKLNIRNKRSKLRKTQNTAHAQRRLIKARGSEI